MLAMIDLQEELLTDAKRGMRTAEGAESLELGEVEMVANVITVSIVGGAWAAMDEWGTGSLMDDSNPALGDYIGSQAWNPVRLGKTIVSRPNQPGQVNIFGAPVNGHGAGGVDLEELGIVEPQPPSHAIQTAMRWMKNGRMRNKIRETVASFAFHKYFITTK